MGTMAARREPYWILINCQESILAPFLRELWDVLQKINDLVFQKEIYINIIKIKHLFEK